MVELMGQTELKNILIHLFKRNKDKIQKGQENMEEVMKACEDHNSLRIIVYIFIKKKCP